MRGNAFAPRRPFLSACLAAALILCALPDAQALFAAQNPASGPSARKSAAVAANRTDAPQNIYAQAPYTEKELVRFIESMPLFLAWARTGQSQAHPATSAAGKPDFVYTPEAAAKAKELGWEPRRFFCLLGRTAAALYLVGEGTDTMFTMPPDMPTVTETEMALVRKHLASMLRAGAGGPPPEISR
ncbi:MAG: serine/threonine protein phosphatase [Deltaproteobacteria bacterium]|jgi:hypothetical protein|nr:serine/threonine protein phosphatase [Deltaproteobacteria bacterium]